MTGADICFIKHGMNSRRCASPSSHNLMAQGKKISSILFFIFIFFIYSSLSYFSCHEESSPEEEQNKRKTVTPAESFAQVIPDFMKEWDIPGGAVALVKDEKLVMAEGYGVANKETQESVSPDSLFRIASLSKPITATAILKLYEEGWLNLDDQAFYLISDIEPPNGQVKDKRIYKITIRDLLQHSGGWDREKSFDPMFKSREIAEAMGVKPPAEAETIIKYMLGQPLDFTPGERYAYSNFGYCVLGRIIERVTGMTYEEYVQKKILSPMGITKMRIGHSLKEDRAPGEVIYYDYPGASLVLSVFPNMGLVPYPYGGFYLEAMDAHGGWLASVVDLMSFVTSIDRQEHRPDILQDETIKLMVSRPNLPDWVASDWYYAFGWQVRPVGDQANWWHTGSLPGTIGLMVKAYNGLAWAALFNSRPFNYKTCLQELDNLIWQAVSNITEWPSYDLFPVFKESNSYQTIIKEIKIPDKNPRFSEVMATRYASFLAGLKKERGNLLGLESGIEIKSLPLELKKLGFCPGDVILEINGEIITCLEDVLSLKKEIPGRKDWTVILTRGGKLIRIVILLR